MEKKRLYIVEFGDEILNIHDLVHQNILIEHKRWTINKFHDMFNVSDFIVRSKDMKKLLNLVQDRKTAFYICKNEDFSKSEFDRIYDLKIMLSKSKENFVENIYGFKRISQPTLRKLFNANERKPINWRKLQI